MLLAACGARDALDVGSGAVSGSGGAAGTATGTGGGNTVSSSASSSTSSGTGGAPSAVACTTLVQSGEPIQSASADPVYSEFRVRLVPTTPETAAVAIGLEAVELPGPLAWPISHTSFFPWGEWPANIGEQFTAAHDGGLSFQASPGENKGFALLLSEPEPFNLPVANVYFAPSVPPSTTTAPLPTGTYLTGAGQTRPLSLTRGAATYLGLHEAIAEPLRYLTAHITTGTSGVDAAYTGLACGNKPLTADAVPSADGYLAALSSHRPLGTCFDDNVPIGVPNKIHLARVSTAGGITAGASVEGMDDMLKVALVPRSDGAWLVWQESGASAEVPPPIMAAPVNHLGEFTAPPLPVTGAGFTYGLFEATALGDKLAVAWVDVLDPGPPTMIIQVIDEAGGYAGATGVSSPSAWISGTGFSLLGSPSGDRLLAAWATFPAGGADATRIEVTRLDCVEHN
jgi:hypothetical protein